MKILLFFRILILHIMRILQTRLKNCLFLRFLRIICSLKHICLKELFTNWSVKLTLFFRANIFSIGIASLLIFSLILKDFIPYQTMHFIVSNFTLTIVEGRFHEYNNSDVFCDMTTKEHILLNLLLMKLLRLYK